MVVVRLLRDARVIGTKRLVAQSCAEAVDAVTAVVALAVSSTDAPGDRALPRREPEGQDAHDAITGAVSREAFSEIDPLQGSPLADAEVQPVSPERGSVQLSAGVDRGTFTETLGRVGLGGAWVLGRGELRGTLWYYSPYRNEVIEEGVATYSESVDFAAASMDYCYGLDRQRWAAACGGLELGLVRFRSVEEQASVRQRADGDESSLGATVGTLLTLRRGPVQPVLSLSARLPTLGGPAGREPVALRAALGASVPF